MAKDRHQPRRDPDQDLLRGPHKPQARLTIIAQWSVYAVGKGGTMPPRLCGEEASGLG